MTARPGRLELTRGRTVKFERWGPETSDEAIVFLHGTPGGSHAARALGAVAETRGAGLVSIDRPGYGESTPEDLTCFADYGPTAAELIEKLGVERPVFVGHSNGSGFAAAASSATGGRLVLLAGRAPTDRARPRAGRVAGATIAWCMARRRPSQIEARLRPKPDLDGIERTVGLDAHVRENAAAVAAGSGHGVKLDFRLHATPWNLDPSTIGPGALVIVGDRDRWAQRHGRRLAEWLSPFVAVEHVLAEANHWTPYSHTAEVLDLIDRASSAAKAREER